MRALIWVICGFIVLIGGFMAFLKKQKKDEELQERMYKKLEDEFDNQQ